MAASDGAALTARQRFERSMVMDFDMWHDGTGYDLQALREATPEERREIEALLAKRRPRDWRDVEALAELGTLAAQAALGQAADDPDHQVRLAVLRHAPQAVDEATQTAVLVQALRRAPFYGGLTQALGQAEEFHPPAVVDALWHGVARREGEVAVHFAALLLYLYGQAQEPFDWTHRPFFLEFHTEDKAARAVAVRELRRRVAGSAVR